MTLSWLSNIIWARNTGNRRQSSNLWHTTGGWPTLLSLTHQVRGPAHTQSWIGAWLLGFPGPPRLCFSSSGLLKQALQTQMPAEAGQEISICERARRGYDQLRVCASPRQLQPAVTISFSFSKESRSQIWIRILLIFKCATKILKV